MYIYVVHTSWSLSRFFLLGFVMFFAFFLSSTWDPYCVTPSCFPVQCFSLFSHSILYGFKHCFPGLAHWLWNWLWAQSWVMTILYRSPINVLAHHSTDSAPLHHRRSYRPRPAKTRSLRKYRSCLYYKTGNLFLAQIKRKSYNLNLLKPSYFFLLNK